MNFGILALEVYVPKTFVNMDELEKFDKVDKNKYTKGLGQLEQSIVSDREDAISMAMNAVKGLMTKYQIDYKSIGRLEVGTETIYDHSKSLKTYLMDLFYENTNIEGVTNLNACYGGTAALFNIVDWMHSPSWDGRLGIVVCTDIAVYKHANERPTGGSGAVAVLLGPNAPLVLQPERVSYMSNVFDFFKPQLNEPWPIVDGNFSIRNFLFSLEKCYLLFKQKAKLQNLKQMDYLLFHNPFNRLVYKATARLCQLDNLSQEFENIFQKQVDPACWASQYIGNIYNGSLYLCLCSLLSNLSLDLSTLPDKKLMMYSYGSGSTSSIFYFKVSNTPNTISQLEAIRTNLNLQQRLKSREQLSVSQFLLKLDSLKQKYNKQNINPQEFQDKNLELIQDETYYLEFVKNFKRKYSLKPIAKL